MYDYPINDAGFGMFRYTGQVRIKGYGFMAGEIVGLKPERANFVLEDQAKRGLKGLIPLSKEEFAAWKKDRKARNEKLMKARQANAEKKAAQQGIPVVSQNADVDGLRKEISELRAAIAALTAPKDPPKVPKS